MPWLSCLALAAATLGTAGGVARLAAIDDGALDLAAGSEVVVRGHVAAVPRRSGGEVEVEVETADGRLMVRASEPVPDLSPGTALRMTGTVDEPGNWESSWLERLGIRDVLRAREVAITGGGRAGLSGLLDAVRSRAEAALGKGTTAEAGALLRGFVLGQDDRIDAATVDDFKRSGLAHLLAVSGQNVVLLAILTAALLGALGVRLRMRLLWILAAIAVYVPVAGAGPSIQRAGVMGAAGVIAALADRPASRWYALLLAATVTLALDPRASADIGWQLSFAAVVGILLLTAPLGAILAGQGGRWRRALAQGVALTIAATLATAPLMALHFGTFSLVTLPANLAALPAEAPVMWLGMLSAILGQLPWFPVDPVSWLAGALAGYIAQVAAWFGSPSWAQLEATLSGPAALIWVYLGLGVAIAVLLRVLARRRRLVRRRPGAIPVAATLLALLILAAWGFAGERSARPHARLRLTVLDVGQGDSILLEPADGAPVLVDTGPAAADVAGQLQALGVERLAALVISHPEADHDGGAAAILGRLATDRLVVARARQATTAAARASGTRVLRVTRGARLRSGSLRLEVLWPPGERLDAASARAEPNLVALVLLARWQGFEALLTADAEAEGAQLDAGEVEVLKVAHHGSEDAGLETLLAQVDPQVAVISVGADNPYGHPAPGTLEALEEARVPTLRTDLAGAVTIEAGGGDWWVVG